MLLQGTGKGGVDLTALGDRVGREIEKLKNIASQADGDKGLHIEALWEESEEVMLERSHRIQRGYR